MLCNQLHIRGQRRPLIPAKLGVEVLRHGERNFLVPWPGRPAGIFKNHRPLNGAVFDVRPGRRKQLCKLSAPVVNSAGEGPLIFCYRPWRPVTEKGHMSNWRWPFGALVYLGPT